MEITKDTVKHVGHLARIELQDKELDTLSIQLKSILDFIDQLKELNTKDVLPTSHILPLNNVLREDECRDSLTTEKALQNAPQKKDNFFVVPKIIE
ncbi:MAG: Asp-tRNA(Asn)/Glu-tRNA(Gln) amidotransferase subunit GatC [Candidatus Omnitrophica bacterium]|jgi:aspartyl-tRNA(Asn)/glutamyl-tRNA(Gln) amidotransferase subunit C|nr:Asp-tRNA(Asn)/Glu-tRNA(Gln) amidotransferase subunit GatC [Candidatus Omnitrophota bacterium]